MSLGRFGCFRDIDTCQHGFRAFSGYNHVFLAMISLILHIFGRSKKQSDVQRDCMNEMKDRK